MSEDISTDTLNKEFKFNAIAKDVHDICDKVGNDCDSCKSRKTFPCIIHEDLLYVCPKVELYPESINQQNGVPIDGVKVSFKFADDGVTKEYTGCSYIYKSI